MAAGTFDLDIEAEASYQFEATYNGPDYPALGGYAGGYAGGYYGVSGAPMDITGYTAKMQARKRTGTLPSTVPYFTLVDGDGITLGGKAGTVKVFISGDRTAAVTSKTGVYDLYLVPPGDTGARIRLLEGAVTNDPTSTVF